MTSGIPLDDLKAALAHLQEAAVKMTGKNKTEAQKVVASLAALIAKLGAA